MQNAKLVAESRVVVELLVRALVSDKTAVVVSISNYDTRTVFEVSVGERDRGKVIGASGRIARSARILLAAIGNENKANYMLSITG